MKKEFSICKTNSCIDCPFDIFMEIFEYFSQFAGSERASDFLPVQGPTGPQGLRGKKSTTKAKEYFE
jgi:hypothetical protein